MRPYFSSVILWPLNITVGELHWELSDSSFNINWESKARALCATHNFGKICFFPHAELQELFKGRGYRRGLHFYFSGNFFFIQIYGSVQQKRASECARCLFRVKGALFNSLIIVCCLFEKKNQAPISIDFFLLFPMVPLFLLQNAFFRTKTRVEYWKPFFSKYIMRARWPVSSGRSHIQICTKTSPKPPLLVQF